MGAAASTGEEYKIDDLPKELDGIKLPNLSDMDTWLQSALRKKGGVAEVRALVDHIEKALGRCKLALKHVEVESVKRRRSVVVDDLKFEDAETLSIQADAVRNAYALKRLAVTRSQSDLDIVNALIASNGSKDEELQSVRHVLQREQHEQRKAMTRLETYYESLLGHVMERAAPMAMRQVDDYNDVTDAFDAADEHTLLNSVNEVSQLIPPLPAGVKLHQDCPDCMDTYDTKYLNYLRHRGKQNQSALRKLLLPPLKSFMESSSLFFDIQGTHVVVPEKVKGLSRICEKVYNEYDGDFRYLLDISRASIVCEGLSSLTAVVKELTRMARGTEAAIEILRLKNRFRKKGSGGYMDIMMNIRILGAKDPSHICELQLHHRDIFTIKHSKGHKLYSVCRSLGCLEKVCAALEASNEDVEVSITKIHINAGSYRPALNQICY